MKCTSFRFFILKLGSTKSYTANQMRNTADALKVSENRVRNTDDPPETLTVYHHYRQIISKASLLYSPYRQLA